MSNIAISDTTVIRNARLPHRAGLYQISIEAGRIRQVQEDTPHQPALDVTHTVVDVAGDWISLGAVDLQINGALGLAFPDLRIKDVDRLQAICDLLWQQGVDSFVPTLVTTSLENFQGSLGALQSFMKAQTSGAKVLGAHLEGPFLNEAKRGAHPAAHLQPLTLDNVKTLIDSFGETVSIVTLAPELEQGADVISWLTAQGMVVSLGHSLATAQQAKLAFAQGASMVTHAFNAMPGLHHREPGLLGAALTDDRVFCGFIADGQHIEKTMLDLLLRLGKGQADLNGLFLVSDALSPLGLPDGKYPWDTREIEVINGTARLADGTLSGTTLPLIAGAQNLVKWGLCGVEDAIALVTDSPRRAIGLPTHLTGQMANLLRWHQEGDLLTWQRLWL